MSGTTNRVEFEEAADLLTGGRACVAYVNEGRPRVEPVVVHYSDSRFLIGVAATSELDSNVDEVSLVVDEGVLFFDLRAVSVRGKPTRVDGSADSRRAWFEVQPTKTTCWDYGRLRATDEDL